MMKRWIMPVSLLLALGAAVPALALDVSRLTDREAVSGLQEALNKGAAAAVGRLGALDGFWGNDTVRIPLPDTLRKAEKLLNSMGLSKQADELKLTLNRAAESAVKEAKPILVGAIRNMSWQDAKGILTGGETAATDYFRRTTSDALAGRFLPIVSKATGRLKLADKYNAYAGQAAKLGLLSEQEANLDQYVTHKAMDGLYYMIAEEEKAIRRDPVGQASKILRKVFGG
ncbi:DUF4197 domain-containing protein [Leeia aquatica]|nr:DUF4197 domain-containing protein [Leeia aquatica]